jgi:hypothetical protein
VQAATPAVCRRKILSAAKPARWDWSTVSAEVSMQTAVVRSQKRSAFIIKSSVWLIGGTGSRNRKNCSLNKIDLTTGKKGFIFFWKTLKTSGFKNEKNIVHCPAAVFSCSSCG